MEAFMRLESRHQRHWYGFLFCFCCWKGSGGSAQDFHLLPQVPSLYPTSPLLEVVKPLKSFSQWHFYTTYSIIVLTALSLHQTSDIQINIKRCLSDGCDTRIHGLKTLGYQITKSKEVSVSDASAIWYLSLLTSLVTASMETNPALAHTVLQSTQ